MRRTLRDAIESSPISATVDKLWEAWYFLLAMTGEYQDPHAFRYNLNAFIQALRNVTFMLQSEPKKPEAFDAWYASKREEMGADPLLRRFLKARNFLVKKSMLAPTSEARMGLFRWRRFKLGVGGPVDPFVHGLEWLKRSTDFCLKFYLDEEHSSLGEQAGVWRKWVVEQIGDEEIVVLCGEALRSIASLVEEASALWGVEFDASFELPHPEVYQVLVETDMDPDLPRKWRWERLAKDLEQAQRSDAEPRTAPDETASKSAARR